MSSSPELFRHSGASVRDWTGINSPGICKCCPCLNYSATLGPLSATEQELTHLGFAIVVLSWTIPPLWSLCPWLNMKCNKIDFQKSLYIARFRIDRILNNNRLAYRRILFPVEHISITYTEFFFKMTKQQRQDKLLWEKSRKESYYCTFLNRCFCRLKVLSSEMDPAEIRLIR